MDLTSLRPWFAQLRSGVMDLARSPRSAASAALAVAAIALLLYRFLNLRLAPFIQDEPYFLGASLDQLRTGHWVSVSPLVGTQGVHYGPSILWFYGLVQWLFGARVLTCIALLCVVVTASHLGLAVALTRAFDGGLGVFAAILGWIASSPYQFFWSRAAWDPLVDVCAACIVIVLCKRGALGIRSSLCLGVLFGIAISSHLMCVPLVILAWLVAVASSLRPWRRMICVAVVPPVIAGLINIPYLMYTRQYQWAALTAPGAPSQLDWSSFGDHALETVRVGTLSGIRYFFDQDWVDFVSWLGGEHSYDFVALPKILMVVCGLGLFLSFLGTSRAARRVASLGAATWIGYALFYAHKGLPLHPHYQFPTWWITGASLAGTIFFLRRRRPWLGQAFAACVVFLATIQGAGIVEWMRYVSERGGTRGVHYSTAVGQQMQAIHEACESGPAVHIVDQTIIWPASLAYLAMTEPSCEGHSISICGIWSCSPPSSPTAVLRRLQYAAPVGGAVVLR